MVLAVTPDQPPAADQPVDDLDAPGRDDVDEPAESAPADEEPARCARAGCGNTLPPRPRHPDGRPKGGRPGKFCSATCRSAARPGRLAGQRATLNEATRGARTVQARLEPLVEQLTPLLETMAGHLATVARVETDRLSAAEEDAGHALDAATAAEKIATDAEAAKLKALEEARRDCEARQIAEQRSATAISTERHALREAREHAEARVAAEKDADQARKERDDALAERDTLRGEVGRLTALNTEQGERLAAREGELTRALDQAARSGELLQRESAHAKDLAKRLDEATAAASAARQETGDLRAEADTQLAQVRANGEQVAAKLREKLEQFQQHAAGAATAAARDQERNATLLKTAELRHQDLQAQIEKLEKQLARTEARAERAEARLQPPPATSSADT